MFLKFVYNFKIQLIHTQNSVFCCFIYFVCCCCLFIYFTQVQRFRLSVWKRPERPENRNVCSFLLVWSKNKQTKQNKTIPLNSECDSWIFEVIKKTNAPKRVNIWDKREHGVNNLAELHSKFVNQWLSADTCIINRHKTWSHYLIAITLFSV